MDDRSIRVTDYWILYEVEDEKYLMYFDSRDAMLKKASEFKAFDDCCPRYIVEVGEGNDRWHYAGWEPGMVYHWWSDKAKEWERGFREWDH